METLEILKERQNQGYATGDDDGRKLYVAVDGGGMGGVISLGALHQLNEEGLLDHVDGFAGSSAGSINSAYVIAQKALEGRDMYVNYLPDHQFIRYTRPLKVNIGDSEWPVGAVPLPLVEMRHLEDAMRYVAPLATRQVVDDPRELVIGSSNLDNGQALAVSSHELRDSPDDLITILLAGATLPLGMVQKYYSSKFGTCADAALFWPTADSIARVKHPTHILSIASTARPEQQGGFTQKLADVVQAKWCSNFSSASVWTLKRSTEQRDHLIGEFVKSDRVTVDSSIIERVYPDGNKLPVRQTMDKHLLQAGFDAGRYGIIGVMQRQPRVRF